MVDALTPALGAYELELRMGGSLEAASGAREAAAEGMRGTIPLQARKGRASYLGRAASATRTRARPRPR